MRSVLVLWTEVVRSARPRLRWFNFLPAPDLYRNVRSPSVETDVWPPCRLKHASCARWRCTSVIDRQTSMVMRCRAYCGLDWIEQCFTSPPTQYRLYGRRFLQVKRPNQQYQSTEGGSCKKTPQKENTNYTCIHTIVDKYSIQV